MRIAQKNFVGAQAGQNRFQPRFFGGFGDKKTVHSVYSRLVHRFKNFVKRIVKIFLRYFYLLVVAFYSLRNQPLIFLFGKFRLVKNNGKRGDGFFAVFGGQCRYCRRIQAAA